MYRRLPEAVSASPLRFQFDGRPMTGQAGDTVAAALLANGINACRETQVSDALRGPYCMMGICFDCLVVIDGTGNRQGCLTPLVEGMVIATQPGRREVAQ